MKEERLQLIPQKYKGSQRNYYEDLYAKKFENLGEMDTFLETHPPKLSQEEAESLKRQISASEIEAVIKNFQHPKALGQRDSQNFSKHLEKS